MPLISIMDRIFDSNYEESNAQDIRYEAHTIVQDILRDVINIAIRNSDPLNIKQIFDIQDCLLDDSAISETYIEDTAQNSDSAKDYKKDVETILQNLKCKTLKSPKPDVICSLEQQIQNIIEEIKDIDNCLRKDSVISTIDGAIQDNIALDGYTTCIGIEPRPALLDLTVSQELNVLPKPNIIDEMCDEEIELQVIDLNAASNMFRESYKMAAVDLGHELDEIYPTKQSIGGPLSLEHGDQRENLSSNDNYEQSISVVKNHADSPNLHSELEGKMCDMPMQQCATCKERKMKKNFGSRLWMFFTKKQHSANSLPKEQ